jgi:hypothetical protein
LPAADAHIAGGHLLGRPRKRLLPRGQLRIPFGARQLHTPDCIELDAARIDIELANTADRLRKGAGV